MAPCRIAAETQREKKEELFAEILEADTKTVGQRVVADPEHAAAAQAKKDKKKAKAKARAAAEEGERAAAVCLTD